MKKFGYPLFVLLVGALVIFILNTYTFFAFKETIMSVISALYLFILGTSFNRSTGKRKHKALKMICLLLFILFLLLELNAIKVNIVIAIVNMIGLNQLIYYAIYVYLGFLYMG